MAVGSIVCIKYETFDKYDFLKDIPYEEKCKPPKNGSYCAFLAVRGPEKDGVIELHCYNPKKFPVTLVTEDGKIYKGLSKAQVKDFYKKKLDMEPTGIADKKKVRSFFIKMFGGEEFTPKVKEKVCKEDADCPVPKSI